MDLKILLKLVEKQEGRIMFKEGLDQFYFNCRSKNVLRPFSQDIFHT